MQDKISHVPVGLESQNNNLAIDFDGVLHTFDKGYHDGTCYGEPVEGSYEALKNLSERYNLIIFTILVLIECSYKLLRMILKYFLFLFL